ncbi:MAG: nitroreductase family protein [bacterium]
MDAYRAIISKRDTRHYTNDPIPDDQLTRILQAGRMAGSSKNSQPVRMVVMRDPSAREALASCGDYSQPILESKLSIAIVLAPGGSGLDAGRAAQNLMVAAWAEGIASCPVSLHRPESASTTLALPPEHTVAIVVALGFPDTKYPLSGGRQRLPLDELVKWDRWSD